jgi:hypothetical protein
MNKKTIIRINESQLKNCIKKIIKEEVDTIKKETSLKEEVGEKTKNTIDKWRSEMGDRKTAIKLIDYMLERMVGMSSGDLADTATFANGIDGVEDALVDGDYKGALNIAGDTAKEMIDEEIGDRDFEIPGFEGTRDALNALRIREEKKESFMKMRAGAKGKVFENEGSEPEIISIDSVKGNIALVTIKTINGETEQIEFEVDNIDPTEFSDYYYAELVGEDKNGISYEIWAGYEMKDHEIGGRIRDLTTSNDIYLSTKWNKKDDMDDMVSKYDDQESGKYTKNMDDVELGALSEEVGDMFEGDKDQMEASGKKVYYHVLEDGGYGNIGYHGYYDTQEEAQKRADNLSEMFPNLEFYVESSNSTQEPYSVTSSSYNPDNDIYEEKLTGDQGELDTDDEENGDMFKDVKKEKMQMEDMDLGHEDDEPHMLKSDLYHIGKYAMALYQMVDQFEGKGEVDFPHWWQSKIIKAKEMMSSAKHYLDFELKEPKIDAMVDAEDMMNEEINRFKQIINY